MYGVGGVDTNPFVTRNYPTPPVGLGWDADIDLMFERFRMQEGKRTTISDAAYFCLTVLVSAFTRAEVETDRVSKPTSSRGKAAQHFRIDLPVLDKIGNLTGNRGGRLSRKKQGTEHPLTPGEEERLKGALRLVIWRVAQVAGDPRGTYDLITMADLPVLPDRF